MVITPESQKVFSILIPVGYDTRVIYLFNFLIVFLSLENRCSRVNATHIIIFEILRLLRKEIGLLRVQIITIYHNLMH